MLNNSLPEKLALYEIKWKNVVQSDRPQMTIQYSTEKMQFACWITKK